MSGIVLRAAQLARQAHGHQTRKYTGRPYIEHPARVAGMVAIHPLATEEMIAAAFLHDTLEDTGLSQEQIEKATNRWTLELVRYLTNASKGSKLPRAERKKMDREHLAKAPVEAKIIKLIDRIDNLREMEGAQADFMKLYAEESLLLLAVIGDADSRLNVELGILATRMLPGAVS